MILELLPAAFLVWMLANGNFDPWLARWRRRWRRKHHRGDPAADPVQTAADAFVAVDAPDAAVAIAIVTPEGVRQAFAGRLDGADSPAPDADTPFEVGSITKTFTAALLVAMEQAGRLQLDTPLDTLLPDAARSGRRHAATLADLASHSAGLPRLPWGLPMLAGLYLTPRQPYRFIGARALQHWLSRHDTRHDQGYRYSNLGYGVLGAALATAAGSDYAQALHRFVLAPLGLADTRATADADCAQPHSPLGRRVPAWDLGVIAPAGGIRSTLADMTRWLQANMAVSAPLDARLHAPRIRAGGAGRRVALAWQVDGDGDGRVVWHNGRTGGSSSMIAYVPARDIGVVALSNSAAGVHVLATSLLQYAVNGFAHAAAKPPPADSPVAAAV
jgi:CubicO group peptidase (beta-lactamase class C family)